MLAIVCPGQGSQTPGFLTPWLEVDGARDLLESLSDAAGVDLVRHGTASDEETIKDTAVAQPLIVAAGLVAAAALEAGTAAPGSRPCSPNCCAFSLKISTLKPNFCIRRSVPI